MTAIDDLESGPARRVKAFFDYVYRARMTDVPLCNRLLSVDVPVMECFDQGWLGVVITPWMLSLIVLPKSDEKEDEPTSRENQIYAFPSGEYPFTPAFDADFGRYYTCSLFSPMNEFASQDEAVQVAHEVYKALFLKSEQNREPALTRRGFFARLVEENS